MSDIKFNAIAAMCDANRGIGKNNSLPWHIPNEFKYFLKVVRTTSDKAKINALIVGRLTWLSMPVDLRPLEPCLNIILTSKTTLDGLDCKKNADKDKIIICKSLNEALELIQQKYSDKVENVYSIGGSEIYKQSIEHENFNRFYLTRIFGNFECDTFIQPENFLSFFKKLENDDLKKEAELYNCDYNSLITDAASGIKYVIEVYEKKSLK